MLINEGGLIRAIKRAYKAGGYTVLNTGNDVAIYTDHWFAMANRALLPRKVLATIVEHMGMIPEKDMPTSIIKDTEPQLVLRETAADDSARSCMASFQAACRRKMYTQRSVSSSAVSNIFSICSLRTLFTCMSMEKPPCFFPGGLI